jgi:predicted amidophosphoribosyltransferase
VTTIAVVANCIGCGCDDNHACPGGCWWLRVDYAEHKGVCSECEDRVEAWDCGDRTSHAEPVEAPDPGDQFIPPAAAECESKRTADGRCDHNWPRASPHDADNCTRCGMSFVRHVFTECP